MAGVTYPQIDLALMAQALPVGEVKGFHQTGLLALQEQSPPDKLLLALLHTVQLHLHHKPLKVHIWGDTHKARKKVNMFFLCASVCLCYSQCMRPHTSRYFHWHKLSSLHANAHMYDGNHYYGKKAFVFCFFLSVQYTDTHRKHYYRPHDKDYAEKTDNTHPAL